MARNVTVRVAQDAHPEAPTDSAVLYRSTLSFCFKTTASACTKRNSRELRVVCEQSAVLTSRASRNLVSFRFAFWLSSVASSCSGGSGLRAAQGASLCARRNGRAMRSSVSTRTRRTRYVAICFRYLSLRREYRPSRGLSSRALAGPASILAADRCCGATPRAQAATHVRCAFSQSLYAGHAAVNNPMRAHACRKGERLPGPRLERTGSLTRARRCREHVICLGRA